MPSIDAKTEVKSASNTVSASPDKVLDKVFVTQKPKKKFEKAIRSFNKRVSNLGATISRTTGLVDGDFSDSEDDEGHSSKYFHGDDGNFNNDSEFRIIHDSLVPISDQASLRGNNYDFAQQRQHDELEQEKLYQRNEVQLREQAEILHKQWAEKRPQQLRKIYSELPKVYSPANKANYIPQQYHHLYNQFNKSTGGHITKRHTNNYHHHRHPYDDPHIYQDMQNLPPPPQQTSYSFMDDVQRQEHRKKRQEEDARRNREEWLQYIDPQGDQYNDYKPAHGDNRPSSSMSEISYFTATYDTAANSSSTHTTTNHINYNNHNNSKHNNNTNNKSPKVESEPKVSIPKVVEFSRDGSGKDRDLHPKSPPPIKQPDTINSQHPSPNYSSNSSPTHSSSHLADANAAIAVTPSPKVVKAATFPTNNTNSQGKMIGIGKLNSALFEQPENPSKYSAKALFSKFKSKSSSPNQLNSSDLPVSPESGRSTETEKIIRSAGVTPVVETLTPPPHMSATSRHSLIASPVPQSHRSSSPTKSKSSRSHSSSSINQRTPSPKKSSSSSRLDKLSEKEMQNSVRSVRSAQRSQHIGSARAPVQPLPGADLYNSWLSAKQYAADSYNYYLGPLLGAIGTGAAVTAAEAVEHKSNKSRQSTRSRVSSHHTAAGAAPSVRSEASGSIVRPGTHHSHSAPSMHSHKTAPKLSHGDESDDEYRARSVMDLTPPSSPRLGAMNESISRPGSPDYMTKGQRRFRNTMNFIFQKPKKQQQPVVAGGSVRDIMASQASHRSIPFDDTLSLAESSHSKTSQAFASINGLGSSRSRRTAASRASQRTAMGAVPEQHEGGIQPIISSFVDLFRSWARFSFVLRPVDAVADAFPSLQNVVVIVELVLLMWILYQVSIIIETIATAVRTVCMPVIMLSRALGIKV